jgi:hypothetical protein
LVEPPGIAPGSGPLITGAFIAIVRANPDDPNIGTLADLGKGEGSASAGPSGRLTRAVAHRTGLPVGQNARALALGAQARIVVLGRCRIDGAQFGVIDVVLVHGG